MSDPNIKANELIEKVRNLDALHKQEEELLVKIVSGLPRARIVIDLPVAKQWKYEYQKTIKKELSNGKSMNSRETGVATARHVEVSVYNNRINAYAGPNRSFTREDSRGLHGLLERLESFEAILELIGEELDRQLQAGSKDSQARVKMQAQEILDHISRLT